MSRNILALDISDRAVTAVAVKSRIKGNWIEDHARIPIDDQNDFDEAVARALDIITGKMNFSGAVCVASLPVAFLSIRNLKLPFKEKKKIRQILPFELETSLPIPPEDIIADFFILDGPTDRDTSNILAAAVDRHRLESFLNLLQSHGIEPEVITAGCFALSQCLNRFTEESKGQLLLNIDANRTTLAVNRSGQIQLVRSFAGNTSNETGIHGIVKRVQQTLAALEENSGAQFEIDDIRVTGTAAGNAHVMETIEKMLGVPATSLDLMTHSGLVALKSGEEPWQAQEMNTALALALVEISGMEVLNFRQGRFAVQKAWVEHKRDILKTGILAACILALFLTNMIIDYYTVKKKAQDVQKEIVEIFRSTFPEVTKIVDPLHQMRLEMEDLKKEDLFPDVAERSTDAIEILNDISRLIGDDVNVALNSIIIGSDSVLISGDTDTFNAVDDMKNGLEKGEAFKAVAISSANMDKSGDKVRFKLKITI